MEGVNTVSGRSQICKWCGKGWSLQYALYLDLRPGSRLGQGVNGFCSLQSTGQGQIYKVKIRVKVKGLQLACVKAASSFVVCNN